MITPTFRKSKSVREQIIEILSQEWPLAPKKIYDIIRKERNVTFQAIFKELRFLIKENVLKKHGNKYMLNIEWLEEIQNRISGIKNKYNSTIPWNVNTIQFNYFESLAEACKFQIKTGKYFHSLYNKNKVFCSHYFHSTWPLIIPDKLDSLNKKRRNRKVFCLCAGNTSLDKWCCEQESKFGYFVKPGVPCASICDISTYVDFVVETYIPSTIRDKINKFYKSVDSVDKINISKFFEDIMNTKSKILVLVIKNRELADVINEYTLSHFPEKSF